MRAAEPADEWAWQRQSVWSQAADKLKAGPRRARLLALALTVLGAALALAGSQVQATAEPAGRALSFLAAAAVGVVGIVRGLASKEQVGRWVQARSISEALKSEVMLFRTRCGRYAGEDREQQLDAELRRLEDDASALAPCTSGLQPKVRAVPPVHDVETYVVHRLTSQIDGHYVPRGKTFAARASWFRRAEIALAVVAAILAAIAGSFALPGVGAWAPVVTTIVAALATHAAAERYEFLALEYNRTAQELSRLRARRSWPGCPAPSPQRFVERCEEIISMQNDKWMAKWSGVETEPGGGGSAAPAT